MKGTTTDNTKFPAFTFLDSDKNGIDNIFIIEKEKYNGAYPTQLLTFDMSERTNVSQELSLSLDGVPDKIRSADFNADGMPDMLITTSNGYYILWNRNGSFSNSGNYHGTSFNKCDVIELGDFDGDGLVDLIINKNGTNLWYIARNTGNVTNGYFNLSEINALIDRGARMIEGKEDKTYCLVQDIDGDGKSASDIHKVVETVAVFAS